ncbi:MAG: GAF domain-containing protein [Anaerolineales bacterium]|nr:GAF domain-containing protein [Anaerolineales bacterium]
MSNETNHSSKPQTRNSAWRSLWESFTYSQKVTGIVIVFMLSLFAFTPLIADQNARIQNYERSEEKGVSDLQALWQFSADIQTLRILSIERESGTSASDDAMNQALAAAETDLASLQSVLQGNASIQDIQVKWSALKEALQKGQAKDTEANFITLNNSLAELVTEVGNQSRLILDSEIDTHYLMNAILLIMPENNELVFQIWKISYEANQTETLTVQNQFKLSALVGRLHENVKTLDQNLQTSFKNDSSGQLEADLSELLQNYLATTESFVNLHNAYLANTRNYKIRPAVLKTYYTNIQEANRAFYASASENLQKGIQKRAETLTLKLHLTVALAASGILIAFIIGLRAMRTISAPLAELLQVSQKLIDGDTNIHAVKSGGSAEAGKITQAFEILTNEVQNSRVVARMRAEELERRTKELEAVAEAARDISIVRDVETMLSIATTVIHERFDFDHTSIFLLDERNEYAVIRAASGEAAQELLDQGYKVRLGAQGLINNVLQTGQAQTASASADYSSAQTSLLPESKSELGLPLRGKSLTIGVLNIHSKQENAFSRREIQIFQILADQLSSAINNAQLVAQVESTLTELNTTNRAQTKLNWDAKSKQEKLAYEYDGIKIQPLPQNLPTELRNQLESGKTVILEPNRNSAAYTLVTPLIVSGQIIGVIGMERIGGRWTSEEISIAEATANRTAITLENARLLEESQRRALKEKTISESTARLSAALSVENILGIAAEELEKVIGDASVILQIAPDSKSAYEQTE